MRRNITPNKRKKVRKVYRHPEPARIVINEADLKLYFEDYQKALKKDISWSDFLWILPAWAVMFTLNFQGFWGLSGGTIRGIYGACIAIATIARMQGFWIKGKRLIKRQDPDSISDAREKVIDIMAKSNHD